MIFYSISANIVTVFAQQVLPNIMTPHDKALINATKHSSSPSSLVPTKLHLVKITSPTKGQQVPLGKDLLIQGTSIANATSSTSSSSPVSSSSSSPSSHCQVAVIVNGIKPYQPTNSTGHSTWNYILTSKYTTLKQGPNNKITARYACMDNPSIRSFYNVNVTGVLADIPNTTTITQQQPSHITVGNSSSTVRSPTFHDSTTSTTRSSSTKGTTIPATINDATTTKPTASSSSYGTHYTGNHDVSTRSDNNIKSKIHHSHSHNDNNNNNNIKSNQIDGNFGIAAASAGSNGATATAGDTSVYAGPDGISIRAGSLSLRLP